MTEQPVNEPGDESAEPTRTWAPPVEPADQPAPPATSPDDSVEEVSDAIEEGMPLIPEDEPASPEEPETVLVEPTAPAEPVEVTAPVEAVEQPAAAEPTAVTASDQPEAEPAAAAWHAVEPTVPAEPVEEAPVEVEPVAAEPARALAEPEPAPEPTDVEPAPVEPAPVESVEQPVAEPTRVLTEPEPAQPEATVSEPAPVVDPGPSPVEVTAPTAPVGFPETLALPPEADTPPTEAIFRDSPTDAVVDPYADPLSEEAQKLAAERAARKEARDAALAAEAPTAPVTPEPVVIKERTNDKFLGSLGIFLLRLVVAGIFAVRGYQMLADLASTQEQLAQTLLAPYAQILAIVVGVAHLLIALGLILGLLTRVAGLGVALVAGGALGFVWWGPWNPFVAGRPGFLGELELVLTVVGLLLLLIGGGGWSIDRSFRSARAKDKAARQLAP